MSRLSTSLEIANQPVTVATTDSGEQISTPIFQRSDTDYCSRDAEILSVALTAQVERENSSTWTCFLCFKKGHVVKDCSWIPDGEQEAFLQRREFFLQQRAGSSKKFSPARARSSASPVFERDPARIPATIHLDEEASKAKP
jgi:hypothetical protein